MAGKLQYTLGLSTSGFTSGMKSAMGAVEGLGNAVRSAVGGMHMLNGAVELVGKALSPLREVASQVQDALNIAAAAESTQAAFETLVGSAEKAKKVLSDLVELDLKSSFEFAELTDAGRKLIAFGSDAGTVAEELRRIGDVSAGVQAPIAEIAEIYGKARVQGQLFAEDINQLVGRGIPVIQQFANITGRSTAEIKKLASEGKITFPLLDQAFTNLTVSGSQFFGMMETQSRTTTGLWQQLGGVVKKLKEEFGKPINDALKPLLTAAIEMMGSMKTKAREVGQVIADWITYIRQAFESGNGWDALITDMKLGAYEVGNIFIDGFKVAADYFWSAMDPQRILNKIKIGFQGMMSSLLPDSLGGEYFTKAGEEAYQEERKKDDIGGLFNFDIAALKKNRERIGQQGRGSAAMKAWEDAVKEGLDTRPLMLRNVGNSPQVKEVEGLKQALKDVASAAQSSDLVAGFATAGKAAGEAWGKAVKAEVQGAVAVLDKKFGDRTAGGRVRSNPALDAREAAAERKAARLERRASRLTRGDGPVAQLPGEAARGVSFRRLGEIDREKWAKDSAQTLTKLLGKVDDLVSW